MWSTRMAPGAMPGQRAVGAERHRAHVVVVADAGEHDLGAAPPPRAGVAARCAAELSHHASAVAAVRLKTVTSWPLAGQMAGHRKAHHTQADEGHSGHAGTPAAGGRTLVGRP